MVLKDFSASTEVCSLCFGIKHEQLTKIIQIFHGILPESRYIFQTLIQAILKGSNKLIVFCFSDFRDLLHS